MRLMNFQLMTEGFKGKLDVLEVIDAGTVQNRTGRLACDDYIRRAWKALTYPVVSYLLVNSPRRAALRSSCHDLGKRGQWVLNVEC